MEKQINKPDWILIVTLIIQITLGIAFIYSFSGSYSEQITGNPFSLFHRYLLALLFSFIAAGFVFRYFTIEVIKKYAYWLMGLALLLLIVTYIPSIALTEDAGGLRIPIGSFRLYIVPVVTLLLIISASRYIAEHINKNKFFSTHTGKIALILSVFSALILYQPNGNGAVILSVLIIITCFSAKLYKLSGLLAISLLLVGMMPYCFSPYRVARFISFLNPFDIENQFTTGYQLSMSLSAIGGGGLWGVGYGEGLVKQFFFPGAFHYYLYAAIIEEMGSMGGFVVICCSMILQWRSFTIAQRLLIDQRNFEGLLVIGISSWITLLSVFHIAGTLGLFPQLHVPYPFLSFNTTYLFTFLIGYAVILRIGTTVSSRNRLKNFIPQFVSIGLIGLLLLLGFNTFVRAALDTDLDKQYLIRTRIVNREIQKRIMVGKEIPASKIRGRISDRYGKVLAKNILMYEIWADPRKWDHDQLAWKDLMALLSLNETKVSQRISESKQQGKSFVYLKRKVDPDVAKQVKKLAIKGVYQARTYDRYYPQGELVSQVVGVTSLHDIGQEGLELHFEELLKNRQKVQATDDRHDLQLSIDLRIQQVAFDGIKNVVRESNAKSGSVVMLNAITGEVLAMVNAPSFDPQRPYIKVVNVRNRVVSDVFEPGETIMPFTLLAALESKLYTPETLINTDTGYINIGNLKIKDNHSLGKVNLTTILHEASKVGISKIALDLPKKALIDTFKKLGFGELTQIELPRERKGAIRGGDKNDEDILPFYIDGRQYDVKLQEKKVLASLSYGYSLAVTPIQLGQAYMVIANEGKSIPITILKRETPIHGKPMFSEKSVEQLRKMLMVDNKKLLIGKSGIVHKATVNGGYSKKHVMDVYAGISSKHSMPLVIVVTIDQPKPVEAGKGNETYTTVSEKLATTITEKTFAMIGG